MWYEKYIVLPKMSGIKYKKKYSRCIMIDMKLATPMEVITAIESSLQVQTTITTIN